MVLTLFCTGYQFIKKTSQAVYSKNDQSLLFNNTDSLNPLSQDAVEVGRTSNY
jgi:hypothetical protein